MSEVSTKFPPVIVTSPINFMGLTEGVMLEFDYNTAKYVSVTEKEDIGPDDNYFYSGSAIALDPYLVKNNIGEYFSYVEGSMPEDLGNSEELADEYECVHVFPEKTYPTLPENEWVEWTKGDLVTTCHNCGNVDVIAKNIEGGIQSILPVDNHNEIRLVCNACNSAISLHFAKAEDGEIKVVEEAPKEEAMKGIDLTDQEQIKEDEPKTESK